MTETTAPKSAKKPRWTSLEICLIAIVSLLFIIIVALVILFATQKTGECCWWKDPGVGVGWDGLKSVNAESNGVCFFFFFSLREPPRSEETASCDQNAIFRSHSAWKARFCFSWAPQCWVNPLRAHMQSAISPRPGSWLMVGVEWRAEEELFCSGGWKTLLKQSAKVQPLSRKEECCVCEDPSKSSHCWRGSRRMASAAQCDPLILTFRAFYSLP